MNYGLWLIVIFDATVLQLLGKQQFEWANSWSFWNESSYICVSNRNILVVN